MLPANVCAGFFCYCYVGWGFSFFGVWELFGALCVWGMLVLLVFSLILTGFGLRRCVFVGHAFWAEVGGDISFVTLGSFLVYSKTCCSFSLGKRRFWEFNAVYASLGGTAQSPWP